MSFRFVCMQSSRLCYFVFDVKNIGSTRYACHVKGRYLKPTLFADAQGEVRVGLRKVIISGLAMGGGGGGAKTAGPFALGN